jgi:hypothetical protein
MYSDEKALSELVQEVSQLEHDFEAYLNYLTGRGAHLNKLLPELSQAKAMLN